MTKIDQKGPGLKQPVAENRSSTKTSPSIQECRDALWETQAELESYSFLLRRLSSGDGDCDQLYGLGVALGRMARQVVHVAESLTDQ